MRWTLPERGARVSLLARVDGTENGNEADVDCGGDTCPACPNGDHCLVATDCMSGACVAGICS